MTYTLEILYFRYVIYNLLDDENFCVRVLSRVSQIGAWKCDEMVPVKDSVCFALDLAWFIEICVAA